MAEEAGPDSKRVIKLKASKAKRLNKIQAIKLFVIFAARGEFVCELALPPKKCLASKR